MHPLRHLITLVAIVLALLLGLGAAASHAQSAAPNQLPNILYILADQWRASATGYAGDPNVKTPNLDRLAKESLDFRNAVSVLPVCTPYRAALMTGRFPTTTGMFLNDVYLPDESQCMAEIFAAAGYATGYIGKWHLDGHGRRAYIPPERRQGWQYWKAGECDHNYNHSHYYTGASPEIRFWQGYDAFAETNDARQYLRDRAKSGGSFVLVVAYGEPHFPHDTAPEEYKQLYNADRIKLPDNVPANMQAKARKEARGYYAHCSAIDHCVGELRETLKETGLAANTMIVFTADHGEMLGSHGVPPFTKQVAWSESAQIPFLLHVPGIEGRVVKTPLTTPDILPTLLGLSGIAPAPSIEGEDLSPLLRAGRDTDRVALYMNVAPFVSPEFATEYRALRTDRYTYVRRLEGPWMLFDNEQDPGQMHNLIGQPEHAALEREMDALLAAQLKKIGDDFRPGSAHIAEWGFKVAKHGSIPYSDVNTNPQTPHRTTSIAPPATKQ